MKETRRKMNHKRSKTPENASYWLMKSQRIIALQVSASSEGSCKITISAHTPDSGAATERRRRKEKDFASPSSQSKIQVLPRCCCLLCDHCSNWTWVGEETLAYGISCVLHTARSSLIRNYADPLISLDLELLKNYR